MFRIYLLIITSVIGWLNPASAHDPRKKPDIQTLIRAADFVFLGTVANVDYKLSSGKGEILPHTFVSYRVEKILKGNFNGNLMTLRFLGGRGKEAQFMVSGETPLFDVGDRDVLFVKGNTINACPLATCATGRFRSIKSLVYDDEGRDILLNPRNAIARGKFNQLDEVLTHHVSQTVLRKVIVQSKAEGPQDGGIVKGKHFDEQSFVAYVDGIVRQLYTPEQLKAMPPVAIADISKDFLVRKPAEVAPKVPAAIAAQEVLSPEDQAELDRYHKNGDNPVLQ